MERFAQEVQDLLGISLSAQQLSALVWYEKELLDWNTRINLTAISDITGVRTKHFLDSLTCILAMGSDPQKSVKLIDIGTGAGFPGIPLKIVLPNVQLTLVESVGKKANFCTHIAKSLQLEKTEVVRDRAEAVGQDSEHREHYDWAVARAVAGLPTLVEYLLPLVRVGGAVLAQKGESGPAEAHAAEHAIRIMGGHLRQLHHVTLSGVAEERYLIVIDKVAATPPQYPRRTGAPSKHPVQNQP